MSVFSSIAVPGGIPVAGSGKNSITPDALFSSAAEKMAYQRLINEGKFSMDRGPEIRVNKVKVEIFDLSDMDQRAAYEKLWAELLEKASRMEVIVEHSKDLVRREDGTSYWMKYVEYVEFGSADGNSGESKKEGVK